MKKKFLNKFYKKSLVEKIEALKLAEIVSKEDFDLLQDDLVKLPVDRANDRKLPFKL